MRTPCLYVALVAVLVGLTPFAGAAPEGEKPRVLILQVGRIIDQTDEGRDFVGKLVKEKAEKEKELNERAAKLAETKRELAKAELADRTPEYYERLEKAMSEHAKIEMEKQIFIVKKSDEIARATQELLKGALGYARKVMKERGADLVLSSRLGPLKIGGEQNLQEEMLMRRVLCLNDGEADITDEVIKRMNAWYKENRRNDKTIPERAEGASSR